MSDPTRQRMLSTAPSNAEIKYDNRLGSGSNGLVNARPAYESHQSRGQASRQVEVVVIPDDSETEESLDEEEDEDDEENSDEEKDEEDDDYLVEISGHTNYPQAKRLFELLRNLNMHTGSPTVSKTFSSAPNPGLSIGGSGTLRLPISSEDAETLASIAKTDDNTRLKNIGLEELGIRNDKWKNWINEYVQEIGKEMGINEDFQLEAKLVGLRVYTIGHNFKMEGGGTGGTLEITLPGEFESGEVSLHFKNEVKKVAFGKEAMWDTVAAAW
ncbi:hypothetical protein AA313_de0205673 [Arthrobotrys entomopaga]|nr:hypothetical protein AA313_de0205673 [Arthrobotrys entomopaga]